MRTLSAALLVLATVACSPDGGSAAAGGKVAAAAPAGGEAIYRRHCAACHGTALEGQPDWRMRKPDGKLPAPPHDDSGHTWHHPGEQLFAITKFGLAPPNAPPSYASDMPAFGATLSDDEISAVLAYIESRWSPEVRKMRRQRFGG